MDRRIGVYVCECGPNIADRMDIDKLIESLGYSGEDVVLGRHKLLCSPPGKNFLKEVIETEKLTHLVVGACSPKQHETTFMNVCEDAGLNPYLFQIINIREQCAWITEDRDEATQKGELLMRAGIERVRRQIPLKKEEIERNPDVLVIGGGVAGIEASMMLASKYRKVYLVEKGHQLGGRVMSYNMVVPGMKSGAQLVGGMIENIKNNDNITIFTDAEVEKVRGFFGNFVVEIRQKDSAQNAEPINVGAIVVATGTGVWDPTNDLKYSGYTGSGGGNSDILITADELEKLDLSHTSVDWLGNASSVGIIHCVGRDNVNYCSQMCCKTSLKYNRLVRELSQDINVVHFYRDICMPGKDDMKFYLNSRANNVEFVRSRVSGVKEHDGKVLVSYTNSGGDTKEKILDRAVLVTSLIPPRGSRDLARLLNISVGEDGYFQEGHVKLGCVTSTLEGIFMAGCAHEPMGISSTIEEADAVSGRILSSLAPGKISISPEIATVDAERCIACLTCVRVCPYMVPEIGEEGVAVIQPSLCKGCGTCVGECPAKAIQLQNYTDDQIMIQCGSLLLEVIH